MQTFGVACKSFWSERRVFDANSFTIAFLDFLHSLVMKVFGCLLVLLFEQVLQSSDLRIPVVSQFILFLSVSIENLLSLFSVLFVELPILDTCEVSFFARLGARFYALGLTTLLSLGLGFGFTLRFFAMLIFQSKST